MCLHEQECEKATKARAAIRSALDGYSIASVDKYTIETNLMGDLKKIEKEGK